MQFFCGTWECSIELAVSLKADGPAESSVGERRFGLAFHEVLVNLFCQVSVVLG